jgi:hypothetical protein
MEFFQTLMSFFSRVFPQKTADAKIRREIRRIENIFRSQSPVIYQKRFVQPVFAEALYGLYIKIGAIGKLLTNTVQNPNRQVASSYSIKLLQTAFTDKIKDVFESLAYESIKAEMETADSRNNMYEQQRRRKESFIEMFSTPQFKKIETALAQLHQLWDICQFNYVSVLSLFDIDFKAADKKYKPRFRPVPIKDLESFITDFYFLKANFFITGSVANALVALMKLNKEDTNEELFVPVLKKINLVFRTTLAEDVFLNLYRIIKNNPGVTMEKCLYTDDTISVYRNLLHETFLFNQQRIQIELADKEVRQSLAELFEQTELKILEGYNSEINACLLRNTEKEFFWILPLQILKTFLSIYFDEQACALFNDLCIEGFFCNISFKTDFAFLLQTCGKTGARIEAFEHLFSPEEEDYEKLIFSSLDNYYKDSGGSRKKLADIVNLINVKAKQILQEETTNFINLQARLSDILSDARRTEANYITNIKLLFSAPQNRERRARFERQFSKWSVFINIMRNYAVLSRNNMVQGGA